MTILGWHDAQRTLGARVAARVRRFGGRLLPHSAAGDYWIALWDFLAAHRRLPERRPARFSDHLFAIRTNGALGTPLYQFVTDKELVKLYVELRGCGEYNVPTYQVLRGPADVDAFAAPRLPCVIKPTSGVGRTRLCRTGADLPGGDMLRRWLATPHYPDCREPNHQPLKQKIIVEEFVSEDGVNPATECWVYCFNGEPGFAHVVSGHFSTLASTCYDMAWNRLPAAICYPPSAHTHPKPELLPTVLAVARRLAQPFPFVRVDFYVTRHRIFIGEITVCPGRAAAAVSPPEAQHTLGRFFGASA